MTTVGRFSYDEATGAISGPKAYMESAQFAEWKERFASGNDPVFRVGMGYSPAPGSLFAPDGPQSPDPITAMLVSVQTDFAGWHGLQRTLKELELGVSEAGV